MRDLMLPVFFVRMRGAVLKCVYNGTILALSRNRIYVCLGAATYTDGQHLCVVNDDGYAIAYPEWHFNVLIYPYDEGGDT